MMMMKKDLNEGFKHLTHRLHEVFRLIIQGRTISIINIFVNINFSNFIHVEHFVLVHIHPYIYNHIHIYFHKKVGGSPTQPIICIAV